MEEIRTVFIVGACIFGLSALITGLIFCYFIYNGYAKIDNLLVNGQIRAPKNVHWLNSIWIYLVLFTSFLLFTIFYAISATGSGFYIREPSFCIVQWLRWVVMAIVGLIYNGCLAFIITDEDASWNRKSSHHLRAQSFFIVLYYVAYPICILIAAFLYKSEGRVIAIVAAMIAFVISILLYFFPYNKFHIRGECKHPNDYILYVDRKQQTDCENRSGTIMLFRSLYLVFIIVADVLTFIIWFLSKSNGISTTFDFKTEIIAYFVRDFTYVIFGFILIVMTFYYSMKTIGIKDVSGNHTYAASPQVQQLGGSYNNSAPFSDLSSRASVRTKVDTYMSTFPQ